MNNEAIPPIWNAKRRKEAEVLLSTLMGTRGVNGWPLSFQQILNRRCLISLLADRSTTEGQVMSALQTWTPDSAPTLAGFECYLRKFKKTLIATKSLEPNWRVFLPAFFSPNYSSAGQSAFTILGTKFRFRTWRSVKREFVKESIEDKVAESVTPIVPDFPRLCLECSVQGNNLDDVWDGIEEQVDLLRGIMDLASYKGRLVYNEPPHPTSSFPQPPWILAIRHDQYADAGRFHNPTPSGPEDHAMPDGAFRTFLLSTKPFCHQVPANSSLSLAAKCLRLYMEAHSHGLRHQCLLNYWQMAETLVLSSNFGGKTQRIASRLSWFGGLWKAEARQLPEVLNRIADKRNEIVHSGTNGEADSDDLNILRMLCETAVAWIVDHRHQLPTLGHLEQFFRLRTEADSGLEEIRRSVGFIMSVRRKTRNRGNK